MRLKPEKPTAGLRVVLDTNVLVSGLLSSLHNREDSPSFRILRLFEETSTSGPLLLVSDAVLREYEEVLNRPHLDIPPEVVKTEMQGLTLSAELIRPKSRLELADRDDNIFLECALDGLANYLITGNKRDYPKWTIVVTPREFLDAYFRSHS